MMDIGEMIGHGFEVVGTMTLAAMGWFTRSHEKQIDGQIKRMEAMENNVRDGVNMHMQLKDQFHRYQLDATNTFAKETTLQASLGRIHDRLDDHSEKTEQNFKDLRDDIKELMMAVKS